MIAKAAPGCLLTGSLFNRENHDSWEKSLDVHIFSKHLQFLDFKETGAIAAELGFNGVDLTVRPKGHVLPENVLQNLPIAIKDITDSGSTCSLMTTAISDTSKEEDVNIIRSAARAGVKYYRSNWFAYHEDKTMEDSISFYQQKIHELDKLNKDFNIVGCYQNHAGTKVGASYWELKQLMSKVEHGHFGIQYDIRHAMVEGGRSWSNGLRLVKDHIKTIVLKDFKWELVNGKWLLKNVPIGEGMVDFDKFFKILKSYGLNPPVSLHLEYPLGGAEKGRSSITVDRGVVYAAMKADLNRIQKIWEKA